VKIYNSCVVVTTVQPNAYDNKDERKKNGKATIPYLVLVTQIPNTVIKIGGMHCALVIAHRL